MENFYDIKSGIKGKRDSFEELSCQLFRRELNSAERNFQRYRGDGGDGGVEAVYINEDLSEIGLQSKYWENNSFGTSELSQLSDSLTTALTNHPNLKQYYISIPFNLTGKVAEGHRGKSQTEKFEEWKTKNENSYSIKIILWNSTVLSDLLHKHDNSGGLYTYWFDINCLSYESYLRYTDEIIAQAGKRYTPELNIEVPLYKVLNYFSEKEVLNSDYKNILESLSKYLNSYTLKESNQEFYLSIKKSIELILARMKILFHKKDENILIEINQIIDTFLDYIYAEEKNALSELEKKYGEKFHDSPNFRQFMAEYMCEFPCALLDEIRDLKKDIYDSKEFLNSENIKAYCSKTLIITGPAGIGKTHSIVDYMKNNSLNTDFVFFGEDFYTQEPWTVFRDKLGFSSEISKEEIFQIFSINAEAKKSIGIIFIDAINESFDINKWHIWIPILIQEISYYPNLKLCISCRDTYINEFEDEFSNLFIFNHNGFIGNEYLAINSFCEYYKIIPPSYPLFNSEFGNPLFLHLLCETISNSKDKFFPKGQIGLLNIFKNFTKMKNRKISKKCDIDEEDNILEKVFLLITNKMLENKSRSLLYTDFKQILASIYSTESFSKSLMNVLEKESIITKTKFQNQIRIRFSYDKLTDYYIAESIISSGYEEYLKNVEFTETNPSIIEMLSILLPEINQYVEILDYSSTKVFSDTFINGLCWRSPNSITRKTIFYVRKLLSSNDYSLKVMSSLISMSVTPNNQLNSMFVSDLLSENSMCERDAFFVYYLISDYSSKNSAWQLINRACFSDLTNYTEEALFLWCIILCWFCSSSDRRVRDQSSKALTRILWSCPVLCKRVYEFFRNVDDDYIIERLIQAIYSSFLLSKNKTNIENFAKYIIDNKFFEQYSNIIIHDSHRLIIELAYLYNPTFLSKNEYNKVINITSSLKFEKVEESLFCDLIKEEPFNDSDINFVGHWYTDFQRYILKNKIDIFDLEAANISIDDIYKWFVVCLYELGYPGQDKRAYHFDNYLRGTYGSGRGKPIYIERLSKKYYWILLHRLIGLLSNTCKLKPIKYDDEEESLYPLLYSIPLRDIDLSDQRFSIKNKYPKIYSEDIVINMEKDPKEWITDEEDFFEEEVLIQNIRDEAGEEWIPLNFIQKVKVQELDSEYPYRESCILLSSSIIDLTDLEKISNEKMKELVNGNVYDNITRDYRLFLGEYTESRAYNEYEERKYIKEIEYRDDEIKLYPTSCELLRGHEWEYDCSFDSENLLEPAKLFIEKLNLSWDCDSGWIDKNGQLQIFCQSFEEHICLFIRKASLIEFLIKTKKILLFRIYKEKMYVPNLGFNSSLHNKRILLCLDGKNYKYLLDFEDENDYRE